MSVRMKPLATEAVERPCLALLGVEPFRVVTEFAWHKFRKSDDTQPGDGHPAALLRTHCRALGYDTVD
jgi:hypothetical protein